MNKDDTIKNINKIINNQNMLMIRIKNGLYKNDVKHLEQISTLYDNFMDFLKNPQNDLKKLFGAIIYDALVNYGTQGSRECKKINDIFFTEPSGLFKKIKQKDVNQMGIEKAKSYYDDLNATNNKISEYLNIGIQRLHGLNSTIFEK